MRVQRSFGFIDLSGFTAFTELHGDEEAVELLSAFRALVRDICSRRGVRIAKWLGDGAMLVCVDPTPLLEALLEIQFVGETRSLRLAVRCGVSSGPVILHEGDDYIGHAVNVAARLCDLAPGGQALATPALADALPPWGETVATEAVSLRGLERPIDVVRIGFRHLDGPTSPDPVCGIPLTRDVAVAKEQTALDGELWFCSDSCHDTWKRRPDPLPDEHGSARLPLIGS